MTGKSHSDREGSISSGMPAQITKLVDDESDRGAILILGAYLDELLADVIREACVSAKAAASILEFRRPAGDFESRISLCAAFGLIHPSEEAALHAVRKMRNGAAHFDKKGRGFDVLFDSDSTIDLVGNVAASINLKLESRDPAAVKQLFIVSCRFLAIRLMLRAVDVQRPAKPRTLKEKANEIRERVKGTALGESMLAMEAAIQRGEFETLSAYWKNLGTAIRAKIDEEEEAQKRTQDDGYTKS